jgi:hypothetical protein
MSLESILDRDARTSEWLASLKVGDKLAIDTSKYSFTSYSKGTVTKVTPTQIHVQGHYNEPIKFRKTDGYQIAGDRFYPMKLVPLTDEVTDVWRRQKAKERIATVQWTTLPTEVLEAVLALIPPKP